jgi:co-chaperonin GroES (HSP10)
MGSKIITMGPRKGPVRAVPPKKSPSKSSKTPLEIEREERIAADAELQKRQDSINADEQERLLADKHDLVAMIASNPHNFPLEVAGWNILIEQVRPPSHYGGVIEKTLVQQQAEEYLAVIGRVIAAGPTCMEGVTQSGIKLCDLTDTIKTRAQLIGKYVQYQPHTGAAAWFTPLPGKRLRYITATEILGVTTVPSMFMKP